MDLKTYISKETGNAVSLATKLGVSQSYLSQMSSGYRSVSPRRAVEIEIHTNGLVSRTDICPNWQEIWPELAVGSSRTHHPKNKNVQATQGANQ